MVWAICAKFTPSVERSTRNPSSLLALSVQASAIWVLEPAVATRLLGAAGAVDAAGVVALSMLE